MRYLGNKDSLTNQIVDLLRNKGLLRNEFTFCDGFCGMGSVADSVKNIYKRIIINDSLKCASVFTYAKLIANKCTFEKLGLNPFVFLNTNNGFKKGFIYQNYSPSTSNRMYFSKENAGRIDFFREQIEKWYESNQITNDEYYKQEKNLIKIPECDEIISPFLIIIAIQLLVCNISILKGIDVDHSRNLNKVTLPNTITTIGQYAFRDCSSLREINFPSSITEIKAGAFQSCLSLQVADLSQTKLTILESNLFLNSSSLTKAVLPETVTTIKNNSFGDCYALKEVNLPSKLVRIWPAAFIKCKSLEKISLPGTLVNMYHYTFGDCTSLKDVEYLGNNPSAITVQRGGVFDGYTENSTPVNLYLPNVAEDPKNGSWDNFLAVAWKTIHYGKSMPK